MVTPEAGVYPNVLPPSLITVLIPLVSVSVHLGPHATKAKPAILARSELNFIGGSMCIGYTIIFHIYGKFNP